MLTKMGLFLLCISSVFSSLLYADPAINEKVDQLFSEWTDPELPGLSVGVIRSGEFVYTKGFGSANIETGTPMKPESVFYLASVGKQFTTMAIALLQQDGKLDVDDDIRKYIPEFPDYGTPITIRNLIYHTSGIRDYLSLMDISGLPFGFFHNDQDIVDILVRQKALNFEPGEKYIYSNSGYFLLAVIVHRVSGKTLREFAAERMFAPLDMPNSHFHDDYQHPIKGRVSSYNTGDDGELNAFVSTFDRVGSGGVYSSVIDLLNWDRNFYSHEVGGQQVYDWMHQKGKLNDGTELDYAWGLHIAEYRGLNVVQHGGALGGYRTTIARFPEQDFSVIILANQGSIAPGGLAMKVADIYLGELMQASEIQQAGSGPEKSVESENTELVELSEKQLETLTGLYYNNDRAMARRILITDGQLVYSRGDYPGSRTALGAIGNDRFKMEAVPLIVSFDSAANRMSVKGPGQPALEFNRMDRDTLELTDLEVFSGKYHSEELDITVEMTASEQGLVMHHPRYRSDPSTYEMAPADLFVNLESGSLQFIRGDDNVPKGFSLDTERVKGLVFERVER